MSSQNVVVCLQDHVDGSGWDAVLKEAMPGGSVQITGVTGRLPDNWQASASDHHLLFLHAEKDNEVRTTENLVSEAFRSGFAYVILVSREPCDQHPDIQESQFLRKCLLSPEDFGEISGQFFESVRECAPDWDLLTGRRRGVLDALRILCQGYLVVALACGKAANDERQRIQDAVGWERIPVEIRKTLCQSARKQWESGQGVTKTEWWKAPFLTGDARICDWPKMRKDVESDLKKGLSKRVAGLFSAIYIAASSDGGPNLAQMGAGPHVVFEAYKELRWRDSG